MIDVDEMVERFAARSVAAETDLEEVIALIREAEPLYHDTPRSSFATRVGFDKSRHVLSIVMRSGVEHRYVGIPQEVAHDLAAAPSVGTYFNQAIKGHYLGIPVTARGDETESE